VIRAVAVIESTWEQGARGDRKCGQTQAEYYFAPAYARTTCSDGSLGVYESLGLTQIKDRLNRSPHPGTEPLRWRSTAFNLDYYGATIRFYFDGDCSWCSPNYSAGHEWDSIGAWYAPSPWGNQGAQDYVTRVQAALANRTWEQPSF
jgi:hypothetical protein